MSKRREFGNVNKLGSGKYRARFRVDGVWRNAPRTFDTVTDADAWLDEQADGMKKHQWSADKGGSLPFEDWTERYTRLPRKRRKRTDAGVTSSKAARTVSEYESVFRLHVNPLIGEVPIERMDLLRTLQFLSDLEQKLEDHPRTLEKACNYASWVMGFAVRKGAVSFNPFLDEEVTMPDGSLRREPVPLEPSDIEKLAEVIDPHFRLIPLLTAYTGLRAGEVWALKRRSVNPLRQELHVSNSVSEVKGQGLVLGPPKSGRSRRLALPRFVFDLLMEHMNATEGKPDDWLFVSKHRGNQVRHSNFMADYWKQAREAADLPTRTRFHDLRHYCAHYHISAGFEPGDIKELMGHKSIVVTMDIYGGLFNSRRREMADKVHSLYSASRVTEVTRPSSISSIETG